VNPDSGNWPQIVVTFILGGGLFKLYQEIRDRWRERQVAHEGAPERRAKAESVAVATAESVVELVEERMKSLAAETKELRSAVAALELEVVSIRKRADRAERRVDILTRLIRDNAPHIEIPPEES
jgi:hypothetical protein